MLGKEEILKKNVLLDLRRKRKDQSRFDRAKNRSFVFSIVSGLLIIGLVYFLSSASNVYRIAVSGNRYLKDEDIIAMSQLTTKHKFLLVLPKIYEKKIAADPLIESARIAKKDGRLIDIEVKEKKMLAYLQGDEGYTVLLEGNEQLNTENYPYVIDHVPYLDGFSEEEIELIAKNLRDCDQGTINEISEMHPFPELKYQNVQLVMRDGNYIFTSVYGLPILNHYHNIKSSYVKDTKICYYFEDISGNAYSSACPWEPEEETVEEITEIDDEEDEE